MVWCGTLIIVSALSLSLRDKDRLRDRESLTISKKHFDMHRANSKNITAIEDLMIKIKID